MVGEFSAREERAILETIADRLMANNCPEGSTVEFHFQKLVNKKAPQGIYITKAKNARAIPIIVVYDGKKSAKGLLKPVRIAGAQSMTLKDLSELVKLPVKNIQIQTTPDLNSSKPNPVAEDSAKDDTKLVRYTRTEMMQLAFASLFVDLLQILFRDSGKTVLSAREITDLANSSKESFFEDGRVIAPIATGNLLSHLAREGFLKIVESRKSFALYCLADTPPEKKTLGVKSVRAVPQKLSKPTVVNAKTAEIDQLDQLLKSKQWAKMAKDESSKRLSDAKRNLLNAQEELKTAENQFAEFSSKEAEIDKELNRYRSLYQALSTAFGQS